MNKLAKLFTVLTLTVLCCSVVNAQATKQQRELRGEVAAKTGKKVSLFHSGTQDVRKAICVGDVIPVYREVYAYGAVKRTEVGRIRVVSFRGEHYLEAEIVEGKIRRGDVAQKESAACLVHPAPDED